MEYNLKLLKLKYFEYNRSCDVILDNDLVDAMKPGDRVQITGCYR